MRITQWGEYGIHCSVYIAQKLAKGCTAVRATDIAAAQNIALDYAQQILQRLRKNNIIESVRGPQGGYKLARDPGTITLQDILVATEGDTFEVICETKPIDHPLCSPEACCQLKTIWQDLKAHVNEFLVKYTLKDLMGHDCEIPTDLVQLPKSAATLN